MMELVREQVPVPMQGPTQQEPEFVEQELVLVPT
jgi:hypothetical protein